MSGGSICKCRYGKTAKQRSRHWKIVTYRGNRSAFNGWRFQSSAYSAIRCFQCKAVWRTKAKYVDWLANADDGWWKHA